MKPFTLEEYRKLNILCLARQDCITHHIQYRSGEVPDFVSYYPDLCPDANQNILSINRRGMKLTHYNTGEFFKSNPTQHDLVINPPDEIITQYLVLWNDESSTIFQNLYEGAGVKKQWKLTINATTNQIISQPVISLL